MWDKQEGSGNAKGLKANSVNGTGREGGRGIGGRDETGN